MSHTPYYVQETHDQHTVPYVVRNAYGHSILGLYSKHEADELVEKLNREASRVAKHTPGPWTIKAHTAESPEEITPTCDWSVGVDEYAICFEGQTNPNAAADARLISCAPALLKALEFMVDRFGSSVPAMFSQRTAIIEARSVIAKAKGA